MKYNLQISFQLPTVVRAKTIKLVSYLILANYSNDSRRENILTSITRLCDLMGNLLQQPYSANNDFKLKCAIIKVLDQLMLKFPEVAYSHVLVLFPTIWEILQKCRNEYVKVIMNTNDVPHDVDEESDYVYFEQLVDNIFSLIHTLSEQDGIEAHLYNILPDLIYTILLFMSITSKFEREWQSDMRSFFEDNCENSVNNSIRTTLKSLLMVKSCLSLLHAITIDSVYLIGFDL